MVEHAANPPTNAVTPTPPATTPARRRNERRSIAGSKGGIEATIVLGVGNLWPQFSENVARVVRCREV